MESARLEVREMVHALVHLIPTNAESPEDKPFDIETLKKMDAQLLPATILSYDNDEKETDSWEEAILSQYDSEHLDEVKAIKDSTATLNTNDGLGEGILV